MTSSVNRRNPTAWPAVTIVIPIRNEERYLEACLDSILANDYPFDLLEILVVDGLSTDRSQEIALKYAEGRQFIRLLQNHKRIQAAALNLGIREATGEIIVRVDGHTTLDSSYVQECVRALQSTDASIVGGVQRAVGTGPISDAIAIATTSVFGVGDARFRYSEREEWVDTVFLGAWYKRTLEALGGFDEEWVVNQDYELNYRLRQAGGKILLSPKIRSLYYVRSSLRALARQYFRYGLWKVKTLVAHPDSIRWRQTAPPALVLTVFISLVMVWGYWPLAVSVPALYLIVNLAAAIAASRHRGWHHLPLLSIVFAILHFSWGLGYWAGVGRFGIPRSGLRAVLRSFRTVE